VIARLLVVLFALGVALGPWGATPSLADEPPQVEYGALKTLFMDQVGGQIDKEIKEVEQRRAAATDPAVRQAIEAELKELQSMKRQVEDVGMFDSLYGSIKDGYKAVSDLSKEMETGYGGDSSINSALLSLHELGGTDRLKQLSIVSSGANTGLDYYKKIQALRGDLAALKAAELSPATNRLASQLTVMTSLMSNFGNKVPLIGAFIKAYGDVAGQLLKAAVAVDKKFKHLEQGEIRPGVYGDRKEMLTKLQDAGVLGATLIMGLQDAYVTDDHKFALWDRKKRQWTITNDPSLNQDELRKRYVYFVRNGVKTPSPDQVLNVFNRAVAIELTPSKTHIPAGDAITLVAGATRVADGASLDKVTVEVTLDSYTGFRPGTFDSPTRVLVGTPVRWTSPPSGSRSFTFKATLVDAETAAASLEPGMARVLTGEETSVTVTAEPRAVLIGQEVVVQARVNGTDGTALPAESRGSITFSEATDAGYFTGGEDFRGVKGKKRVWVAPREPGTYTLQAAYSGAFVGGMMASHLSGSEASVTVQVKPASWDLTATPLSATATPETPAGFAVRLRNRSDMPQTFVLGGTIGPDSERRLWSTGISHRGQIEVPANQHREITVRAQPRDKKARRLEIEIRGRPVGFEDHQSLRLVATAGAEERQVRVRTSGRDGKGTVAGKESWSGTVAAGGTLALAIAPMGKQRQFCTREVIERNRNMRQVTLHNHGPNGCSWGTNDGRMSAAWKVDSEEVSWSGPGVTGQGTRALFTVPDKPGRYTVTASATTRWSYVRRAPGGAVRDSAVDRASATFTIEVE